MEVTCDQKNITKSVPNASFLHIKHIQAIDEMILSCKLFIILVCSDRIAQCYILLNLRVRADVCCLRNTVTEINSNINVSVVGQIERVG